MELSKLIKEIAEEKINIKEAGLQIKSLVPGNSARVAKTILDDLVSDEDSTARLAQMTEEDVYKIVLANGYKGEFANEIADRLYDMVSNRAFNDMMYPLGEAGDKPASKTDSAVDWLQQQLNENGKLTAVDFYQAKKMEDDLMQEKYEEGIREMSQWQ